MYIDPDLIINKEIFKPIELNSVCSICSGIIIEPVQCLSCENSFCKDCLDDWKRKKGENSCPFRCSNPTFKNSRLIKNLLSNLKFKCQNGCKEEISYIDLLDHYKDKCSNLKIDYKQKYFEYKKKYEDLLRKYNELEKNSISNSNLLRGRPGGQNQNINLKIGYKSKYHSHFLKNNTNRVEDWICDLCNGDYNAKAEVRFRCDECDFDICLKCILLERSSYIFNNIFLCQYHEHLLNDTTFDDSNWICNICKKTYAKKSVKRFRCDKCDFDICNDCKIKEEISSGFEGLEI